MTHEVIHRQVDFKILDRKMKKVYRISVDPDEESDVMKILDTIPKCLRGDFIKFAIRHMDKLLNEHGGLIKVLQQSIIKDRGDKKDISHTKEDHQENVPHFSEDIFKE